MERFLQDKHVRAFFEMLLEDMEIDHQIDMDFDHPPVPKFLLDIVASLTPIYNVSQTCRQQSLAYFHHLLPNYMELWAIKSKLRVQIKCNQDENFLLFQCWILLERFPMEF